MSASIVNKEESSLIVHTHNEKTHALFQVARKELLFPAYATLSTAVVSDLKIFLVYIYTSIETRIKKTEHMLCHLCRARGLCGLIILTTV